MQEMSWCLVLPVLCAAGCIHIGGRTQANADAGRIEVAANVDEVSQAIHQLIAERGWTGEREGVRTSPRDGLRQPENHRTESADTWIYARTDDGKVVHFDISRTGRRPLTVRVGVEDGARISRAEVVSDLAQRLGSRVYSRRARGPQTIRIDSFARSDADPNRYTGHWVTHGDQPQPINYLQVEIRDADHGSRHYSIQVEDPAPWQDWGRDSTDGPILVRWEQPAGVLVLEGEQPSTGGTATFEPNAVYAAELTEILAAAPTTDELLDLFFCPVTLDSARQMTQALANQPTLQDLLRLTRHHVSPEYIQGSREAGYAFSVGQLVTLTNYHIPLATLRDFKRAGYHYSARQFIQIRNYHLQVQDFTAFRDAGYDLSIDEMIHAKNYHVPVEMVRSLHQAGLHYDLDEIIRLRNYHVSAEDILSFRRAGYALSVDDLIKAENYHVDVADAARFKEIGYDFSLDDLVKLRNYRVPAAFIIQLHDPDYEDFTADELISFHQKRIGVETINKIRAAKRKP